MTRIFLLLITGLFFFFHPVYANQTDLFPLWIKEMKHSAKGPFERIRWFCNDGSVLAPDAYACREHGGGVQHGQRNRKAEIMRSQGYYIANIFADIDAEEFIRLPQSQSILKQMILEHFLIGADDGWIFSKARFYRGALQTEDEARGAEALLMRLLDRPSPMGDRFLLMREAVRWLPRFYENAPTSRMRQLSLTIADSDPNFESIRVKLHVKPDSGDAQLIRQYAREKGQPEMADAYLHLAGLIEEVFSPRDIAGRLRALSLHISDTDSSRLLIREIQNYGTLADPAQKFETAARTMRLLREAFDRLDNGPDRLAVLEAGILLEDELFRLAADLQDQPLGVSFRRSLQWLAQCLDVLFGTGLISGREHSALGQAIARQMAPGKTVHEFQSGLVYTAKASEWAENRMQFYFSETVSQFSRIEPLASRYIHDRLHSSLLLAYSHILDAMMVENSRELKMAHQIWGMEQIGGISGLNPGLARGVLRYPEPGTDLKTLPADSIVVLPATTADLPPVAGIITAGKGNILSHVQLLARNLGIPNVSVAASLLPGIRSREGLEVVLAVSPRGRVTLEAFHPGWAGLFVEKTSAPRRVLRADLEKLDLGVTEFIPLDSLRASDSGRIAGPKAANLGELKYHFPESVTDGVVIPFGRFKAFLDQPEGPSQGSMFEWMKNQYKVIAALHENPAEQKRVISATLSRIRTWILETDLEPGFERDLERALEKNLGPDRSYGVFVRSDTNVEDLPGFTGAGLNLTVPHVVGLENIVLAIKQVWASPFTERSFVWRHAFLANPEHVYASVLLMKTVPVEKSGVMVTQNIYSGESGWLSLAVNEGVGGAVSGQRAEEILVHMETAKATLMAQASEPLKRVVLETGGMDREAAGGSDEVLSEKEIQTLIAFVQKLPDRFPVLKDVQGNVVPADVEFGFLNGRLALFQIRPFLDDAAARNNLFLASMDKETNGNTGNRIVDLDRIAWRH